MSRAYHAIFRAHQARQGFFLGQKRAFTSIARTIRTQSRDEAPCPTTIDAPRIRASMTTRFSVKQNQRQQTEVQPTRAIEWRRSASSRAYPERTPRARVHSIARNSRRHNSTVAQAPFGAEQASPEPVSPTLSSQCRTASRWQRGVRPLSRSRLAGVDSVQSSRFKAHSRRAGRTRALTATEVRWASARPQAGAGGPLARGARSASTPGRIATLRGGATQAALSAARPRGQEIALSCSRAAPLHRGYR